MAANFDFNWLDFAFVSTSVPDYKNVEKQLLEKMERLRKRAKKEFLRDLDLMGLEMELGIVMQKE